MTAEEYVVKQCQEKDEKIKELELKNKMLDALAKAAAKTADEILEFVGKLGNQLDVTIRGDHILITSKCNFIRKENDPKFFEMMKSMFEEEEHGKEPSEPAK